MGVPKSNSIDKYITYPLIRRGLFIFKNIHPIYITLLCIMTKFFSLSLLNNFKPNKTIPLAILLTTERILDCFDGEVARYYNKCTTFGHYLDKYSDLYFRLFMIYYNISYLSNTLLQWNIYAYILFILVISLPSMYVIDYINGKLKTNLVCDPNGIAIVVEDNATLICFFLPYLLYKTI